MDTFSTCDWKFLDWNVIFQCFHYFVFCLFYIWYMFSSSFIIIMTFVFQDAVDLLLTVNSIVVNYKPKLMTFIDSAPHAVEEL